MLIAAATALLMSPLGQGSRVEVSTAEGPVLGRQNEGVNAFKGVPFAAPPVGELRWKRPQAVKPWTTPRECFEFGPACPQNQATNSIRQRAPETLSEDCLYLNVWAPEKAGKRPVLFWIHGGGHQQGSGSQAIYDGANLAKAGAVVVTINYRLGVFGFLAHPELTRESGVSGNYGYWDQVAALQWVRRNIEKFGGDPSNVTIFGQSAGAVSSASLLASPAAKGLFQRAILHSGGATPGLRILSEAEQRGEEMIRKVGAKTLKEMRALTTEQLLGLTPAEAMTPGRGAKDWPCVEGDFLPDQPARLWREGKIAKVPLLFGATADDGSMFSRNPMARTVTPESFERQARTAFGLLANEALRIYPHATAEEARTAYTQVLTDSFIWTTRCAGLDMAKLDQPVWQWHFARVTPLYERTGLGAFHGAELSYVFGNMPPRLFAASDRALSDQMMKTWIRFASTGDPNGPGLPTWPKFDAKREATMIWDEKLRVQEGVRLEAMRLMDRGRR